MLFGVPEKLDGSVEDCMEHYLNFCEELVTKLWMDEEEDFNQPVRIGRSNNNSPHLLRLKCKSLEQRSRILRSSRALRRFPEFQNVFVNPDRTPMQQAAHKVLQNDLKMRKQNGEDVMIFRGEIVEKTTRQNFRDGF